MATLDHLLSELRQRDVHLWLEGDRLRYRAAKDALTPEILAEMKARKAELIEFLQQASASASGQLPPIVAIDRSGNLPLSFAQQRFWLLQQFEPNSSSNNMPVVVRFTGTLDEAVLERSLQAVVDRHEVLRATFPPVNGQPTQVIKPELKVKLPIVDLQHLPADQRTAEAHRLATEEAHHPIDLVNGPMLRLLLLRLSPDEHLLLWNLHCLVCDGASSDVFYQDLTAFYRAFSAGQPAPIEPLPIQYVDFAHWQRQWLQGEVLDRQLAYWKRQLSGELPVIALPYNRPRPATIRTYQGDRSARMLPKPLNEALTTLSQKLGVTLFMVLLAAFEILLYRYSQQEEMLISFASAGRGQVETERLLGFFSNTLILRTHCDGNPSFREFLDRVRKASLEAYSNQDLPFEKMIEELRPEGQNLLPLFQVKFALNPPWSNGRGMASVQLPDLTITSLFGYIYHGQTKYDLTLVMREQDEGLGAVFDYNAELFEADTIAQMLAHLQTLLENIVANPDCSIAELPLLNAEDLARQAPPMAAIVDPAAMNLPARFEQQVDRTPTTIAVIDGEQALTYQRLNQRANQLARSLQQIGVQPGEIVGVNLPRSVDLVMALLAVLKVGASYTLTAGAQDAIPWVITRSSIDPVFPAAKPIDLDSLSAQIDASDASNLRLAISGDRLACLVDPAQGWGLSHTGLITAVTSPLLDPVAETATIGLTLAPLDSGIALHEIWGSLLRSSTLVMTPIAFSPEAVADLLTQHGITELWLTPLWLCRFLDRSASALRSLRNLWVVGGFRSPAEMQQVCQRLPQCRIQGVYAPAPTLPVVSTIEVIAETTDDAHIPKIRLGQATLLSDCRVLDPRGQVSPAGAIGRLAVSIPGLLSVGAARSNSPDSGYATADLACYDAMGRIEWLGSRDRHLKVRHFPVQLEQVEAALSQHLALAEVAVVAQTDSQGTLHLVSYVVPHSDRAVSSQDLYAFLKDRVPTYLIPSAFITLSALPLTDRGTCDDRQLPPVEDVQLQQDGKDALIASRDDLELQLTKLWEEVLGIAPIGIRDNFFDLGGHSLLAVRLFAKIESVFETALPLATLLQAPTIEQQAELIRSQGIAPPQEWLVPLQQGNPDKPALFCVYGILLYYDLARHLGADQTVYGLYLQEEVDILRSDRADAEPQLTNVQQVAEQYLQKVRTIQPQGPYLLAGESFGGIVAYEMAQLLQAQGETVSLLAMFDTQAIGASLKLSTQQRATQHFARFLQEGPSYLLEKVSSKLKSKASSVGMVASDDDPRQQFRRRLAKDYTPQPYAGTITLFRALDRGAFESIDVDPLFGWQHLAQEGVVAFDVPGDHIGILKEPNVQVLARHLRDQIHQGLGRSLGVGSPH